MLEWLRRRFAGSGIPIAAIGVEDAYAMLMSDRLMLIDVRTKDEWRASGIARGAHCATLGTDELQALLLDVANTPQRKMLGFLCKAGTRSTKAAQTAKAQGHDNTVVIEGGVDAWNKAGLPLIPFDHI